MQKKQAPQETSSSNWESTLKKQQRNDMMKKVALWGGVIVICILGLAGLVMAANRSVPTAEPVVNEKLKPVSENDIVVGNPNAKVVIIEYADFQCPACAAYNPITNQILIEYEDKVKFVYRFFPLRGIHQNAIISGQAAYAAYQLGKFKEMKDLLYDKQPDWENISDPRSLFIEYAKTLDMDTVEFEKIMNSDEAKRAVENGEKDAISLGINSTPTFFIGNRQFSPNGLEGFRAIIDQELSGKVSQAPLQ